MLGIFGGARSDHPLANAREAKRILAALADAEPCEALAEAAHWLDSVANEPSFKPDMRRQLVQLVDEAGQAIAHGAGRDYLRSSRLGKTREGTLWKAVHGFWQAAALGYVACLDAFASGAKGSDALKPALPLLGVRALRALAAELKWLHVRYGPLDERIWQMINRTFGQIESRKLARAKVAPYGANEGETTPEQEFLRVAMFSACSPDSLLPLELELAERVIASWASSFVFAAEHQPETPYWIDLAGTHAPARIARAPQPAPGVRFFGAGPACGELEALIQQIRGTHEFPPALAPGDALTEEAALGVLEHLQACWSPRLAERRHPRHRVKSRLTIAWGFDGLLEVLEPGDSLTFDGSKYESWIVENVSVGGFGALVPEVRGDWLRIGCLLAMQPEGGDNWLIGVVRRLSRPSPQQAAVGIQTLARSALPVAFRIQTGNATSFETETGILLNPGAAESETQLLLRAGVYTPGQSLSFDLNGRHTVLLPVGVPERRNDYELLRCRDLVRNAA